MNQIPLQLRKIITYQAENFYWHSGLSRIKTYLEQEIHSDRFSATYFYGSARSGKTHLSIVISQLFAERSFYPLLISGEDFGRQTFKSGYNQHDLLIIDDFQKILLLPKEEQEEVSSKFIDLYETLKRNSAKLIIFSDTHFKNLASDDHLGSRLANMQIFSLDTLQDEDLHLVIFNLAKQRGVLLSETNREYLAKRLPRSIPLIESYLERLDYFLKETGLPLTRANLSKPL